jgi:hypothetical protein
VRRDLVEAVVDVGELQVCGGHGAFFEGRQQLLLCLAEQTQLIVALTEPRFPIPFFFSEKALFRRY